VLLVDHNLERTIENAKPWTKTKWSPWRGGRIVYHEGRFLAGKPGARLKFDHSRGGFWQTPDGIGT